MRVHVVDPSAYTPPYDHALCAALAAAGAEVSLYTSRFVHGAAPEPAGYERRELFYRAASRLRGERLRRAGKLLEHVPDMLAYRRAAATADVVHFQWLPLQQLDGALLPSGVPLVLTAHDILPRESGRARREAQRRLYRRFDAVIAHSERGAARLAAMGVDPAHVHVIPHGALAHLDASAREDAEPPWRTDAQVVLCFGLIRPYKGIDLLLQAWGEGIAGAELWIVGRPRMDVSRLRERSGAGVRLLARYVSDTELAACFRRADLVVLPYREIDQSGVLSTALAFGRPLLLSDVGGFPEIARTGAARCFPAGDAQALRGALAELLSDPQARREMASSARRAAAGEYSWESVAQRTLELYESLLGTPAASPLEPAAS